MNKRIKRKTKSVFYGYNLFEDGVPYAFPAIPPPHRAALKPEDFYYVERCGSRFYAYCPQNGARSLISDVENARDAYRTAIKDGEWTPLK